MTDASTTASAFRQLLLPFDLPPGRTFGSFVSTGNEVAVEHLKHLCTEDKGQGRQLYLWGEPSAGKSHLLQAACQAAGACGESSTWLPLARLLPHGPQVLNNFASVDLIGLDELDVVSGDSGWERGLFDLINEARAQGRCLVMAGRRSPAAGEWGLKDLVSRLVWGAVYRLAPLDDAGKAQVLRGVSERLGCRFEDKVLEYLLNSYSRELGSLVNLAVYLADCAKQHKRRITVPFVKEALSAKQVPFQPLREGL